MVTIKKEVKFDVPLTSVSDAVTDIELITIINHIEHRISKGHRYYLVLLLPLVLVSVTQYYAIMNNLTSSPVLCESICAKGKILDFF